MNVLSNILILCVSVALELLADVLLKQGTRIPLGVLSYTAGTVLWFYALRNDADLGWAVGVFAVMNVTGGAVLGRLVFAETLSVAQGVGLVFGLVSLLLLSKG